MLNEVTGGSSLPTDTLAKIKKAIQERIAPEIDLDIVVNVLQEFEGKLCNKRLTDAITAALKAHWPNANCWIEKSGVMPWGCLKLHWWGAKYDERRDLKIADHHQQSTARVSMGYIEAQNRYWFGTLQENNKKYDALLDNEDTLMELATGIDEQKKFMRFLNDLFDVAGAGDLKTSIGKACGIEL